MNRVLPNGWSVVAFLLAFSSSGNALAAVIVDVEEISAIPSYFCKGQPCSCVESAVLLEQTVYYAVVVVLQVGTRVDFPSCIPSLYCLLTSGWSITKDAHEKINICGI